MPLPSIQFVVPEIRAALASLEANLPAQIAVYNAESQNAVDLTVPKSFHFGVADVLAAHPFPQVEVAAVQGSFGQWAVERVETDHDVSLNVVCWLQGDTGQIAPVYERLLGMARVIIEVLSAPDAFGSQVEIAQERGVYWRVTEALPLEMDDTQREVKTWSVPVFIQFALEKVERFV